MIFVVVADSEAELLEWMRRKCAGKRVCVEPSPVVCAELQLVSSRREAELVVLWLELGAAIEMVYAFYGESHPVDFIRCPAIAN